MASAGQRYVETTDAIANAPVADYGVGQLIVDLATGQVYVSFGGAWVVIGSQV
jgi:hypothetical protein